jgi:hypothetical protein
MDFFFLERRWFFGEDARLRWRSQRAMWCFFLRTKSKWLSFLSFFFMNISLYVLSIAIQLTWPRPLPNHHSNIIMQNASIFLLLHFFSSRFICVLLFVSFFHSTESEIWQYTEAPGFYFQYLFFKNSFYMLINSWLVRHISVKCTRHSPPKKIAICFIFLFTVFL